MNFFYILLKFIFKKESKKDVSVMGQRRMIIEENALQTSQPIGSKCSSVLLGQIKNKTIRHSIAFKIEVRLLIITIIRLL